MGVHLSKLNDPKLTQAVIEKDPDWLSSMAMVESLGMSISLVGFTISRA